MFDRAHKKGYHVICGEQSHAEGQLVQYLHSRNETYQLTPVAIGWSRNLCCVCWDLFEALWGPNVFKDIFHLARKRLRNAIDFFTGRDELTKSAVKEWVTKFRKDSEEHYHGLKLGKDDVERKDIKLWMDKILLGPLAEKISNYIQQNQHHAAVARSP